MVWPVILGAAATVGGSLLADKSAKRATDAAVAGNREALDFARESRDIARADYEPYRKAGVAALDRLGRMTGLIDSSQSFTHTSPGVGRSVQNGQMTTHGDPGAADPYSRPRIGYNPTTSERASAYAELADLDPAMAERFKTAYIGNYGQGEWDNVFGRAGGGPLYIVNELGPEDHYSGGKVTRQANPKVVPADPTGYIGRATGGPLYGPGSTPRMDGGVGKYGSHGYDATANRMPRDGKSPGYPGGGSGTPGTTVESLPASGSPVSAATTGGAVANSGGAYPEPVENDFDLRVDPGYNFRFNEGMRALERFGSSKGLNLSGGFARRAIRYGQDYASGEFTNIYNRVASIAGVGQTATQGSAGAAINAGTQMGNAASAAGATSAYGHQARGNIWANAGNQIAQLPWDEVFK